MVYKMIYNPVRKPDVNFKNLQISSVTRNVIMKLVSLIGETVCVIML